MSVVLADDEVILQIIEIKPVKHGSTFTGNPEIHDKL